ncbi:universal stress protein [Desulfopila aestuarii]|uniref:Nucleotide-binding universal stress protein, UspA family n=1 Tax=Desulfopila aestuarii DSM 18488 TaxID=1121416 RepID=A0A1M7Y743_9BACT|nr:universal stress protein [Desulfopila aestuarii]SHO48424.1 Nucleotide-binding universal stress protein, UspA family [Desulfopila aestuarii DSM 18488]
MKNWQKILLAVDGSPTSERAVRYVCNIAPLMREAEVCILNVYPEPPPDYYTQGGRLDNYKAMREARAKEMLDEAVTQLLAAGVPESRISRRVEMAEGRTISEVVLEARAEGDFGTVVAGKRGVSKAEEFLFGSISNALARHSKNFTSWIVG